MSADLIRLELDPLGSPPWTPPRISTSDVLPRRCAVAIVGAGITGLAAAVRLAERAYTDVVVIDGHAGDGASLRSGGIVLGDTLIGPVPGFEGCEYALHDWIARHGNTCDSQWTGCLELDRDSSLAPTPIDWRDAGCVRVAGVVPGGMIDPGKLVGRLATEAQQAGIPIVRATAHRVQQSAGGPLIVADRGSLTAKTLIMAVDAMTWRGDADPYSVRMLTVALETTAVGEDLLAAIGLVPARPFYTQGLPLLWGRPLPHGTMLFGRELLPLSLEEPAVSLRARVATAGETLISRVRGLHPALRSIGLARVWGGPIARTEDGVPGVHRDPDIPGVFWAGGYGGHGLAQAFRVGEMAAGAVMAE